MENPYLPADLDPVSGVPLELLDGLNPEQREATTTLSGPLLVIAGPGSGKTRVLTHRIAALLATGTRPWQVLAVTFTNKAAAEMRERLARLVGEETASKMWIATFHSACVRILRYHHDLAGLPRSFSIADTADAQKIVTEVLDDLSETRGMTPQETKQLVRDIYSHITRAKNSNRSAEQLAAAQMPDEALAGRVMAVYNDRLAARGAVDFDDILLRTLHLLRAHPDVARRYQDKFAHVLVDEFQDTNAVQLEITQILAAHGNLCVVGDADQSIYAFRGANPGVIAAFDSMFPGAKVVALGQNYRSTGNIVAVAQAVIDPNPAQHRAVLRTANPPGKKPVLACAYSNWDEARWVVARILEHGGTLDEHAVLVRTNAQTRTFETVLKEAALPYDLVGAIRFFDRAEVKDALSYVKLAVNPADVLAFERCVNTPKRGIGQATVDAIVAEATQTRRSPLAVAAERAATGGRGAGQLSAFLTLFDTVTAAAADGPIAVLETVLDAAGLRAYYAAIDAKENKEDKRVDNLEELLESADDFVDGRIGSDPEGRDIAELTGAEQTEAFLEYAALMSAAETPKPTEGARTGKVQVATMHAAKGKEWPHVYVVGLEDNICPHKRAVESGDPADLQEERRLLFVAVSRAQSTLDMSYCVTRKQFNRDVENPPSRFLEDLPAGVDKVMLATKPAGFGGGFGGGQNRYGSNQNRYGSGQPRYGAPAKAAPARGAAPAVSRPAVQSRPVARPVPAGPRLDVANARIGAQVRHATLGDGVITALDERIVTVAFDSGPKSLAVAIAPLELVA